MSPSPLSRWHHCHTHHCHFHPFHCCQRLLCWHFVSWHFSVFNLVGQLLKDFCAASTNVLQLPILSRCCCSSNVVLAPCGLSTCLVLRMSSHCLKEALFTWSLNASGLLCFKHWILGTRLPDCQFRKFIFQIVWCRNIQFIRTLHKQVRKTSMSRLSKVSLDNPQTSTYMARKLYFFLMNW